MAKPQKKPSSIMNTAIEYMQRQPKNTAVRIISTAVMCTFGIPDSAT